MNIFKTSVKQHYEYLKTLTNALQTDDLGFTDVPLLAVATGNVII